MDQMVRATRAAAERIGRDYRVRFELGETSDSPPALMDERLRAPLLALLERPFEMASGAGHDAAIFATLGIPTAMIFVRNEHGSHNPAEAMAMDDFATGTDALLRLLVDFPL
jgi:N-carbamoyl-L-amino-acid hydrolase